MKCFIPHPDEYLNFETVKEARDWLSDPRNIEEFFGDEEDTYYVEILWDKDYGPDEDWVHIDGWLLRELRLLHNIPLKQWGPYMILDDRKFLEFDNYEDYAKAAKRIEPKHWTKARGLRSLIGKK